MTKGNGLDTSTAHPARRYNYWLGGKDNFEADRASGDTIAEIWPGIVTAARENRGFLQRAVHYLARDRGIRQFLDIGTGLPTADNTHEVAQHVDPCARIVYVDNDPIVLVHARALLTSAPEGETAYIEADLRDPDRILTGLAQTGALDLNQPVALMLVAVLHFLDDDTEAHAVVRRLVDALAPGSFLVISHGTYDLIDPATRDQLIAGGFDFVGRTRRQVSDFLTGLELVDPQTENQPSPRHGDHTGGDGDPRLAIVSQWRRRPGDDPPPPHDVSVWGAVARKPG